MKVEQDESGWRLTDDSGETVGEFRCSEYVASLLATAHNELTELRRSLAERDREIGRLKTEIANRDAEPCVKGVLSSGESGHLSCIYLRDGRRISVGRTVGTRGPAWLEVDETPKYTPAAPSGDSE